MSSYLVKSVWFVYVFGVYMCDCVFCEHRMHVEMRRHSLQCLTCLQQHLLLTAHSRLDSLCTPGNSPVSTSHLVTGMVGLQTRATMTGLMWLLDTQTQVHTYAMLTFPIELSISMVQKHKIVITSAFHTYLWREGLLRAMRFMHLKWWGTQHSWRIPFQLNDKNQLFFVWSFQGRAQHSGHFHNAQRK